jgi:hypothetical protein
VIFVDIPQVAAAVNINGLEVFHVGGKAGFRLAVRTDSSCWMWV